MDTLNIIKYMNEFRNILAYASNIGFLFGAGTSCAFGLPTIDKLTLDVKTNLPDDDKKLFDDMEASLKAITGKSSVTIEDDLNYLRQIRSLTNDSPDYEFNSISGQKAKELDQATCKLIFENIQRSEDKADISKMRQFIAWYESANRNFLKEIYTTNYDMIVEMALEANYTPYFDGFIGSYEPFFSPETIEGFISGEDSTRSWIRLWKIHGSLNWMKKDGTATSNERIIRVGKINSPVNELMIYPSKEKYSLSRKQPYIAYFDRLKQYLQHGEVVFICTGFSFGDQHINEIIFNALKQNNRLHVIVLCFSDTQVDAMESDCKAHMNLAVLGRKKMIASGTIKKWIYEESTEKAFQDSDLYWDKSKNEFLLGDFNKLTDFLVENSGHKTMIEDIADAK